MRYFLPHESTPSKRALAAKVREAFLKDASAVRLGPLSVRDFRAVLMAAQRAR
jgi:hypothetical protein